MRISKEHAGRRLDALGAHAIFGILFHDISEGARRAPGRRRAFLITSLFHADG